MSALPWALKNGDLDQVKDLVEKKVVDINEAIEGRTPLHFAADYGQSDVLEYLISKGADVNALDKHGISVLLAAIWEGHINCVKILLNRGASKEGSAPDGTTYRDAAENPEIKALLS
ncbi:uncharacterized protein DMENIID0001_148040 [Sergentomyia squamirostris]